MIIYAPFYTAGVRTGYALHKIAGCISGWYEEDGTLIDAEKTIKGEVKRRVKHNSKDWQTAQAVGLLYAAKE